MTGDNNSDGLRALRSCKMAIGAVRSSLVNWDTNKIAKSRLSRMLRGLYSRKYLSQIRQKIYF